MSAIEIEDQIKSLAPDELQKLTDWFVQFALSDCHKINVAFYFSTPTLPA